MEIKVQGKNKKYSELLLLNYCSKFSDLTTFLLFKYEYYLFYKTDTYYSSNMNKLANDSLIHLDIFGKLITLLGGVPNFNSFKINELFYETNKEKLIEINIRVIKEKIILYTNHLNQIDDDYIKEILTNFIIEERKNLEIVELLKIKYKRERF
jgi:rubrerythrin